MNQSFKEKYLKKITKLDDRSSLYIYTSIDKAGVIFFLEEDLPFVKIGDRFELKDSVIEIKSINNNPVERIIERDESRIIRVVSAEYF